MVLCSGREGWGVLMHSATEEQIEPGVEVLEQATGRLGGGGFGKELGLSKGGWSTTVHAG